MPSTTRSHPYSPLCDPQIHTSLGESGSRSAGLRPMSKMTRRDIGGKTRKTLPLAAFVLALFLGMPAAWAAISSTPVPETWGTNGRVRALVELNGILYVGGSFTEAASSDGSQTRPRSNLMAIDMSTGQPTNWAPIANNLVLSIATDGVNLFVGGKFTDLGPHIAEVSTSGAVVAGFGAKTNGPVRSIDVVGSTLYVGGEFTTVNHASQ